MNLIQWYTARDGSRFVPVVSKDFFKALIDAYNCYNALHFPKIYIFEIYLESKSGGFPDLSEFLNFFKVIRPFLDRFTPYFCSSPLSDYEDI